MPEVLADRDARRTDDALEDLEAIAGTEVPPVVEDAVRRQIDLAMHVHELPARPVALRNVESRIVGAFDESGADVDVTRCVDDRTQLVPV